MSPARIVRHRGMCRITRDLIDFAAWPVVRDREGGFAPAVVNDGPPEYLESERTAACLEDGTRGGYVGVTTLEGPCLYS
ncbi:hypothetical protein SAMN06265173_107142 [Thalassovita litoralis]|uniref:Uncharacterized protein n=1 Tax=Thalassovita litoralis TaxID=1010611 RepID=A0A521CT30_9RHOB|nr:hypothetical protein SAMN06265173_107142 [Thalassovita litoralis]